MPEIWFGRAAGLFLSQALVADAEDRYDEDEAAFQRTVDTSEQHGMLYDQAQALYEWAVMYLDRDHTGDHKRSLELLGRALEIFTRCDATKDVEKVIARKEFRGTHSNIRHCRGGFEIRPYEKFICYGVQPGDCREVSE